MSPVLDETSRFRALLDDMGVQAGACVYLHTSFSRLTYLGLTPHGLIDAILEHLGPAGTLSMPSFAWHLDPAARPWKGYADYYRMRPPFDVRHTAANIGVIPELFRSYSGVIRSLHACWSVTARGPLARTLTEGQHEVVEPYGPDSAFGRLHAHDAIVLGLGVTLNTTSLAPVVDHELGAAHTQIIFSSNPEDAVVIDHSGREMTTRAYWLLPEFVRQVKPSAVFPLSDGLGGCLRRVDHHDTIQFAYPFKAYFEWAMRLGAAASSRGDRMPWLQEYARMKYASPGA